MRTVVWIQTTFEGFHRWKNAPKDVAFLRAFHRHIFEVKLGVEVSHGDREIEFFQFKKKVEAFIKAKYEDHYFEASCEMIAEELFVAFDASFTQVSEDGENGAFIQA